MSLKGLFSKRIRELESINTGLKEDVEMWQELTEGKTKEIAISTLIINDHREEIKKLKEDLEVECRTARSLARECNTLKEKLEFKETTISIHQDMIELQDKVIKVLKEKLEKIKNWYARTQGQVSHESALEMIKILGDEE